MSAGKLGQTLSNTFKFDTSVDLWNLC